MDRGMNKIALLILCAGCVTTSTHEKAIADLIFADVDLNFCAVLLQIKKRGFAMPAYGDDSSGNALAPLQRKMPGFTERFRSVPILAYYRSGRYRTRTCDLTGVIRAF